MFNVCNQAKGTSISLIPQQHQLLIIHNKWNFTFCDKPIMGKVQILV